MLNGERPSALTVPRVTVKFSPNGCRSHNRIAHLPVMMNRRAVQQADFSHQSYNGYIKIGISANQFGFERTFVRKHDLHGVGLVDDMIVGDDVAIGIERTPVPSECWRNSRGHLRDSVAKELTEQWIPQERGQLRLDTLVRFGCRRSPVPSL